MSKVFTPFNVEFERKSGARTQTTVLFGRDRDDVMAFVKKHYRKVLGRITSCAHVKSAAPVEVDYSRWIDWPAHIEPTNIA